LSYLAFALGFIFPCAQRCFISRDIFLRAAALSRRRRLGFAEVWKDLGGRPRRRGAEMPFKAAMALSIWSRSAFSSATIC